VCVCHEISAVISVSTAALCVCVCVCVCSFSVNLESIQAETNNLLKRLKDAEKKVSSSVEEVKEQFLRVIEVETLKLFIYIYVYMCICIYIRAVQKFYSF